MYLVVKLFWWLFVRDLIVYITIYTYLVGFRWLIHWTGKGQHSEAHCCSSFTLGNRVLRSVSIYSENSKVTDLKMDRLTVLVMYPLNKSLTLIKSAWGNVQLAYKHATILQRDLGIRGIWFCVWESLKPVPGDTKGWLCPRPPLRVPALSWL